MVGFEMFCKLAETLTNIIMKNHLFIFSLLLLCGAASAQDWVKTNYQKTFIGKIDSVYLDRIAILDTAAKIIFEVDIKSITKYKYQDKVYNPNAKLLPEAKKKKDRSRDSFDLEPNLNSAGDELKIAARRHYTGLGLEALGLSVIIIGNYVNKDDEKDTQKERDKKKSSRTDATIAGSIITFAGFLINVSAFNHIAKAGDKLNLSTSSDGLSLLLKL